MPADLPYRSSMAWHRSFRLASRFGVVAALSCTAQQYTAGEANTAAGQAPKARVHVLSQQEARQTLVIAFGPGDEVLPGLHELARARGWQSAHFSGIGSFSRATLGWFDFDRKEYRKIPREGTLEVVSFSGNVALGQDHAPLVHVHCAVADGQGAVTGGHLLDATVAATLEVFLTVEPTAVRKAPDEALRAKVIQ